MAPVSGRRYTAVPSGTGHSCSVVKMTARAPVALIHAALSTGSRGWCPMTSTSARGVIAARAREENPAFPIIRTNRLRHFHDSTRLRS